MIEPVRGRPIRTARRCCRRASAVAWQAQCECIDSARCGVAVAQGKPPGLYNRWMVRHQASTNDRTHSWSSAWKGIIECHRKVYIHGHLHRACPASCPCQPECRTIPCRYSVSETMLLRPGDCSRCSPNSREISDVDKPVTFCTTWIRPPCAATVGASMHPSPYSEPLTCTSGLDRSRNGIGTGLVEDVHVVDRALRASSISARCGVPATIGRVGTLVARVQRRRCSGRR